MKPTSLRLKFLDHEIQNGIVFYSISITDVNAQKSTWFLKARYSQIRALHLEIEKSFQGALPDFPPKKFFGNLDPNFISQRKKHLENYFNTLLRTVNLDKIIILKDFLLRGRKEMQAEENPEPLKPNKDQANKPVAVKKPPEENAKEGPQNSMIKAIGGSIEKVVDFYTNKMVDITSNTACPEEEELAKRRKIYEKMGSGIIRPKNGPLIEKYRLPKGDEKNLIAVKKDSKVTENPVFFKQIDALMSGVASRTQKIEEFVSTKQLIHNFE